MVTPAEGRRIVSCSNRRCKDFITLNLSQLNWLVLRCKLHFNRSGTISTSVNKQSVIITTKNRQINPIRTCGYVPLNVTKIHISGSTGDIVEDQFPVPQVSFKPVLVFTVHHWRLVHCVHSVKEDCNLMCQAYNFNRKSWFHYHFGNQPIPIFSSLHFFKNYIQTQHLPCYKFARFHGRLNIKTLSSEVRVDKVTPQRTVTAALNGEY